VRLLGVVPAREAFRHGRIAVVPSFAESLPYIVLEATAAGLPVIATRVGGIPEIFGPTADALIEPGSVPALRSAMQRFLDEPAAAAAEARARLDHVRRHFALEAMVDIIEALYRSLLEGRSVN
jgi:glycosyltransferase involved in cell wall biosynthesis